MRKPISVVEAGLIFAVVIIGITGLAVFYMAINQLAGIQAVTAQVTMSLDTWTILSSINQWLTVIVLLIIAIELEYMRHKVILAEKEKRRKRR